MEDLQRHCYICDQIIGHNFRARRSIEKTLQVLQLRVITGNNRDALAEFCPPCRSQLDAAAEIVEKFKEANKRWLAILRTDLKTEVDQLWGLDPISTTLKPSISESDVKIEPKDDDSMSVDEPFEEDTKLKIVVEELNGTKMGTETNTTKEVHESYKSSKLDYICDYCKGTFPKKLQLTKHMFPCYVKFMSDKRIYVRQYICDLCMNAFKTKQSILDHMRAKHKKIAPFSCRFCSKKLYSSGSRKDHELKHTLLYRFRCKKCKSGASTLNEIKRHVIQKHVFDEEDVKNCYTETPLDELRAREEELLKKYICQNCGAGFMSLTTLNSHIKSDCKSGNSKLPWLASAKCHKCDRFFTSQTHLEKHNDRQCQPLKVFLKKKPDLKCPKCDKVFKLQKFLDKHLPSHDHTSAPRDYKCPQCVNAYTSPYALKQHVLRIHEKVFSYFCRYCNKGFYQAGDRCQHERFKHTGEKPWKCRLCHSSFVTPKDLRRHATVHGIKNDEERFQRECALKVDLKPKGKPNQITINSENVSSFEFIYE